LATVSRAERQARDLLQKLQVDDAPVPVEAIGRHLGCTISYEPLDADVSGLLFRSDERKVIGVNSRESALRQRFTIAHEIGHLLLHKGQPLIVDKLVKYNARSTSNSMSRNEEREANQFAAALLMPEPAVRKYADQLIEEMTSVSNSWLVEQLAKRFQVSQQAMEYRLVNLDVLSPMALEGWG
jgi:Zn-dependent peptidase ImmA (M78 family)